MLKLLLGHWKAHRRKPSLLPEDGDIHTNDPSRVNPLYEDSEGSVTSSQPPSGVDPSDSPSLENTREHTGNINLDLVDISVPLEDPSKSADAKRAEDAINHINRVLEKAFDNDSVKSADHAKSEFESKQEPSHELTTNSVLDKVELKNELPETITKLIQQASITNAQQLEASSTSKDVLEETFSDSVLNGTKDVGTIQDHKDKSPLEGIEKPVSKEKKQKEMVPGTSLKTQKTSEQFTSPSTSGTRDDGDAKRVEKFARDDVTSESDAKKNINLKTRAIDELIKKFQGQTGDDGPPLQSSSSFLHSPKRKDVLDAKSPQVKKVIKNPEDSRQQKESLSKIFSFPPPPPIEPLKNDSNNVKDSSENNKPLSKADDSKIQNEGKTRSDSSLSRNKTVSSRDTKLEKNSEKQQRKEKNKADSKQNEVSKSSSPAMLFSPNPTKDASTIDPTSKKENKISKDTIQATSKGESATDKSVSSSLQTETKHQSDQSNAPVDSSNLGIARKGSKVLNSGSKQKTEKRRPSYRKQTDNTSTLSPPPEKKEEQPGLLKTISDTAPAQKETEPVKSQSEDSGITRGDQISSEASPDVPNSSKGQTEDATPSPPKSKHAKEKRTLHSRSKNCKRCKRSRDGSTSLKRGKCDDYYDVLTGMRRPRKNLHSEGWASDLSFEEKQLIRRLRRSRRDTVRSDTPSTKSRKRIHENGYFHRHHAARRSISDDSNFNSSSMCSCDECWLFLVKDYAYGRASLRAMPPNQLLCTCHPMRPDFLGRKVKFRSDTIHEGSHSERASVTPTILEEPTKKEDSADTRSTSNMSSASHDVSPKDKPTEKMDKKLKNLKENYRLMTPWELEEWDLAMRKHLLLKRRKRARYMGFMALAMVVFIGLVVAVVMVYLRRKVL